VEVSRSLNRLLCTLVFAGVLSAQPAILPVKDLHPGMRGTGRTVFSGNKIEEFGVEILGVLENVGPKQSIILGRLSGGPLAQTGVMQGMSGSPVYIDGKLIGAVAMAFSFAKEPIAGIRPIEEMLRVHMPAETPANNLAAMKGRGPMDLLPRRETVSLGETKMLEVATPVSFAGFTAATLEQFGPQLRAAGLEPRQGLTGGGKPQPGNPADLKPGAMISVQLMSGDMAVGADGTVTAIDGKNIYAFGHRFLSVGSTELPFARSEVIALLANLSTSFKISTAKEWMGTITDDRNAAVAGELGRKAQLVPVSITVSRAAGSGKPVLDNSYKMSIVNDRFLSPMLLQMAVFSAIDSTERTMGTGSFAVRGAIEFQDGSAPIKVDNMYAGDLNVPLVVSLSTASPLAYVMQSGFSRLKLKNVSLQIDAFSDKKQVQIDDVWTSRQEVRPGETVDVMVNLRGDNGVESTRKVSWQVPVGAVPGPLFFTVADGATTNLNEYRQFLAVPPRSSAQLISFLNGMRDNTGAYVRVWRGDQGFQVNGDDLPSPPASLALMLSRTQATTPLAYNSKLAELQINGGDAVVSGSKTIQVDIKE
jgi:hypothetical protein